MKLLSNAYENASYEIRIKAGLNFLLQLLISILLIPLAIMVFVQGQTVMGSLILVMDIFFIFTLITV